MKNINQKTLIFYTFQNQSQTQYNVTSLKSDTAQPRIKDVITQLPVDLRKCIYHFRFKSQFLEGEEKIVGWIDILNLMAKVPYYNHSIYVKILVLKHKDTSKIYNSEKLNKAACISNNITQTQSKQSSQNFINIQNTPKRNQQKSKTNYAQYSSTQQNKKPLHMPPHKQKSAIDLDQFNTINITNPTNKQTTANKPKSQGQNLMDWGEKVTFSDSDSSKKPVQDTAQDKLERIRAIHKQQQLDRQNQHLARDQLQDQINMWGYSGKKIINNLTTLLATLNEIWPAWKKVSLGDMIRQEDVNALYKKAAIMMHPDKNRNKHFKERYLSKRIFELLNEAKKQKS